ncbi:hypothetical protein [Deinococcus arenicola]|uniref:META domain-containing protein n=1 Tax=Deinococcus arenicola TaxID=2994950 RepID=A0ABU4DLE4_9DEIO|nr:hypothetical protein [Deinococcus sp. ZS9-10]MDV6373242.1 hypothetical protein [Deinococcus sp. ZS9-10]
MRFFMVAVLLCCLAGPGSLAQTISPLQPGQTWTLSAVTAEGETFQTRLRLSGQPPSGTPATYRADRGVMLLDTVHSSLIALDTADAKDGGLALACVYTGPLNGQMFEGILAAAPADRLPALLETALAVFNIARTSEDRAEASAELGLGRCTLTLEP